MSLRKIPLCEYRESCILFKRMLHGFHAMHGNCAKASIKISAYSNFWILGKKFLEVFFKLREKFFGWVVCVCHEINKITYSLYSAIKKIKNIKSNSLYLA